MKKIMKTMVLMLISFSINAQSAEEIMSNYFEVIGGYDNWKKLQGIQLNAKMNQGGMEIPLEIVVMSDGKQYTKITFQGKELKQQVFDGEAVWNTNFQTMKAEKADAETTARQKLELNDFPSDAINYKENGYAIELLDNESIDGSDCYKIKMTKEPVTIDGEQVEDIKYLYFDTESFILLAEESSVKFGPQKGTIGQVKFSDFQEVEGMYFPFSMAQGVKDGPSQPLIIESVVLNPEIPDDAFAFPTEEGGE